MSVMLASTLKVSLVVLLGLGAAALMRNRSAAVRHWILAAAILCAAGLPVLEPFVPTWGFALADARAPVSTPQRSQSVVSSPPEIELAVATMPATPAPVRRWTLAELLAPMWAAGTGISLLLLLIGFARLTWLASRARPVQSGTWSRLAEQIGRDYGLRRPVQLLESPHPSLLVTWGLIQPKVIIPHAARDWAEDRIAIVLRHELAHVRRGDWVMQIAGELLRAAYWFNPLLWIACARMRQESEQACDDEVLTTGVEGQDYASHLLELARILRAKDAPSLPAPAVVRSSSLERRIRAMLDTRLPRTPSTRAARFLTAGALLTLTVAIAAAQTGPVTLSGTVFDSSGAPVPGVTVALTNPQTQARHEVKTDSSGHYEFVPLPADAYVIQTVFPGFAKLDEPVKLAGQRVQRNLTMTLGTLQETITVSEVRAFGKPVVPLVVVSDGKARQAFQKVLEECSPSTTGGRVRPPRKIKDVRPLYPEHLQQAKVTGTVVLKALIATDGTVGEATVEKSAHPELDAAALEAVRQWQFDGTLLNCVPAEVTMRASINFGSK